MCGWAGEGGSVGCVRPEYCRSRLSVRSSIAALALKPLQLHSIQLDAMSRRRKAAKTEAAMVPAQPMMMPFGYGMPPQACVLQTHSEQNNDPRNESNIYNFCFSCGRCRPVFDADSESVMCYLLLEALFFDVIYSARIGFKVRIRRTQACRLGLCSRMASRTCPQA